MSNLKKADRTKIEILDAAWDMIVERGAAVSLAEIAKVVGITRQSVYVHFGSRSGLLLALVRRTDDRLQIWESFETAIAEENPQVRLDAVLKAWLDFVPQIHPVATDLIRLRSTDPDAEAAWTDRMQDLHKFFRRLVSSLEEDSALAGSWTVDNATDYLWSTVSVQAWDLLVGDRGWTASEASDTIRETAKGVLLK